MRESRHARDETLKAPGYNSTLLFLPFRGRPRAAGMLDGSQFPGENVAGRHSQSAFPAASAGELSHVGLPALPRSTH